jgi:hypothetical protein
MRVCRWSAQEGSRFRRVGAKPSCRSHEHLLLRDAEALASGRAEWVGGKHRAVTPTLRATDRGYDQAESVHLPLRSHAKIGVCRCCGTGTYERECNRCKLDRDQNLIPTPIRWEHSLDRSNRLPENV